ncbi:AAA family ATPase [Gemmatimonas aurantiaca]|nr:AAA family ATPase [Gemmatimonas aurantiaca]
MNPAENLPFIGRDDEISLLHDIYMRTLHNERHTALIEGEPGVGKSTLVENFIAELDEKGALTLKTYGAPNYGAFKTVFAGLLRSFFSSASPRELATANLFELSAARSLARLTPEIRDIIPFEIPQTPEFDPGASHEMEQILDGLRLFLLRWATRKPLVIVFEDAHWFDIRTWEAINFLNRTLGPYPILLLVTLRPAELDEGAQREYHTLSRSHQLERIQLDRLSDTVSRRILERLFGAQIADRIAGPIHSSTGGNPLFLHETVNTLIERQLLRYDREQESWEQMVDIGPRLPAPESAGYIFDERISGFAAEDVTLFRLAALLGFSFQADWLKELSGLPEERYVDVINRAIKANLLVTDFLGRLSFYHQLIQRHLLDSTPEKERRELREKIYAYFRTRIRERPDEGPFYQFLACERYEHDLVNRYGVEIVENNLQAATGAFSSFSTALALRYLETALSILQRLEEPTLAERRILLFQVYLELGRMSLESGLARKAAIYYRVASIFVAPYLELSLHQRMRLLRGLSESYYKIARYNWIGILMRQAETLCENSVDNENKENKGIVRELARMRFISGLSLYNQGQYDQGISENENGLAMLAAHDIEEPQLNLSGLRGKGIILNRIGKHREAEVVFAESLQQAEAAKDRREMGRAHYYLGVVGQYLGEFTQAMERYQRSIAACREADDLETLSKIYNNLGVHYSESGDSAEAERYFRRALEMQLQIGAVYASLTTRINLAGSAHSSGKTTEALKLTREIFDECVKLNAVNLIPAIFDSQIEIEIDAGLLDQAESTLSRMQEWLKKAESKFGVDHMNKLNARLQILRGEYETGWQTLEDTIAIYQEKGESFRAAQTMADGAIGMCEALKRGANIPETILAKVEQYIAEAQRIYNGLDFQKRSKTLGEKILACDKPDGRFGKLVANSGVHTSLDESARAVEGRLQLRCFGRMKVIAPGRHDEIEESAWPSKKARALLAYLATHTRAGRPLSRDMICDTLWGHLGPDTITSSFHVTLSHLRKTLHKESTTAFDELELITHNDGAYNINWESGLWCDIYEFDKRYKAGQRFVNENKMHLATDEFEKARDLYQGPLLEDMYDSWLEEPRDKYRRIFVEITQRLAEISFDKSDYDRAILLSQEALLVDSTEEPSHRLLMFALFTTGRKAAAVNQYNACVKALRKRLDIEPDQKTIDLADLIKNSSPELTDQPPARVKMRYV